MHIDARMMRFFNLAVTCLLELRIMSRYVWCIQYHNVQACRMAPSLLSCFEGTLEASSR